MTAKEVQTRLRTFASAKDAAFLPGFFKTAAGQYGEGDVFIGVRVPAMRKVAGEFAALPPGEVELLLHSPVHEDRMTALEILGEQSAEGGPAERKRIFDFYLASTRYVNNWDLVDLSAPQIAGGHLEDRSRRPLRRLARSAWLWDRRIAIVATHWFIRRMDFADTLAVAEMLLADKHDLVHKAVGWMLREVGKRDLAVLEGFLERRCATMPRTMLRYAIERFEETKRRRYMGARATRLQSSEK